jgi:spoIIIJ-associated protein
MADETSDAEELAEDTDLEESEAEESEAAEEEAEESEAAEEEAEESEAAEEEAEESEAAEEEAEEEPEIEPQPQNPEELREAAIEMCAGLFERMMLDITATAEIDGNRVQVNLTGPDAKVLLGRGQVTPKSLEAVQTVLRGSLTGSTDLRLSVDVDGFRRQRTDRLKRVAKQMAETAADLGESLVVAGFTSFERKVVHRALENDKRVKTESEGPGSFRKLRIDPR